LIRDQDCLDENRNRSMLNIRYGLITPTNPEFIRKVRAKKNPKAVSRRARRTLGSSAYYSTSL